MQKDEAAGVWNDFDIRSMLAQSAIRVGAGTPTDAGVSWTPPTPVDDPIVMAGGIPDPATLPAEELQESLTRALLSAPDEALRYGGVMGFDGLREVLAERQSRVDRVPLTPNNFIMSNGSSGGINNVCDAFVEPGDVVLVEAPTFSGSIRTMRGHMAEIVSVPVNGQGVLVDALADEIRRAEADGQRVKLFYTVADFHNPTGTTMSRDRREALIELCAQHRVLILEDAAYAEIFFDEEPPPSLYGMAGGQGILKVGTFSKPIATGLRVGWVQGRADFIDALSRVRFDMGGSPLLLRALSEYVGSGKMDKHLELMRPLYAAKCDALCRSLEESCSQYLRFARPDGGFFLWVECIGPSAGEIAREAAKLGLIFPVGANFFLRGEQDDTSHVRLAFSTAGVEELERVGPLMQDAFTRALGER
jgi:2-aminoadipate transaminase